MDTQALTSDSAPVCCPVCSPHTENGRAELADAGPKHRAPSSPTNAGAEPGGTLVAALAMIAELPLTPAEKADAVQRLLADRVPTAKA
jgi:hypothetical protein